MRLFGSLASLDYLRPKFVDLWSSYSRRDFGSDVIAGLTVGLVALPLAMAFGIASGVTPQAGLYTAIVGGLIVAFFGGSRTQIAGPTGAFVVIVAGVVSRHGVSGLLIVTMMAGVILVFLGLTGLGSAVKFIPRPVIIGFTNGIAVLIASTQIKDFLGITMPENPSEFFARMAAIARHVSTVKSETIAIGVLTVVVVVLLPRISKRVPGAIVALAAGTLAVVVFKLPVETIGSRFGGIPAGLPPIDLPAFRGDLILPLLPSAMTVAILGAVESLLSAVVADSLTGDRHNSNAELVAQGMANFVVPMVGGIPVTGAIARTATNVRAGAKSPVAGVVHSLTLLTIVLVFAPLARFAPLAALAGVLLVVAYNIGEWREIPKILRLDKTDKSVWLATFALTVFADLTVAVGVGMALAALLYIHRISQTTTVSLVTPQDLRDGRAHVLQDKTIPPYVTILRIHGPFLFGTTDKLFQETSDMTPYAPIVILRLRNMTAIDATGLHALETLSDRMKSSGRTMLLCGARFQPSRLLQRSDFVEHVGERNILANVEEALLRADEIHESFDGVGSSVAHDMMNVRL
jgi:sulfate permease, SulP family